jgi:uncharacterized protein with HEPN domain
MKSNDVLLNHILDSILDIEKYIKGISFDSFLTDTKTQDAIIRKLEIVGEASKNISEDLKNKHSNIPWKQMAGIRDILIHAYFDVSHQIIWETVTKDLPSLKKNIEDIL